MPKSNKAIVAQRVDDVMRLLVAGAEFSDIRQFAVRSAWCVSDRQIRRYMEVAYRRMAKEAGRKRKQFFGLQLKQRRALYARCTKANELGTALQVLRDDAKLLGLYPPTKTDSSSLDAEHSLNRDDGPLGLDERMSRYLQAFLRNDSSELRLIDYVSPGVMYKTTDAGHHMIVLSVLALYYVIGQLELMVLYDRASHLADDTPPERENNGVNDRISRVMAFLIYTYRVREKAWARFTKTVGVDGQDLIAANCPGNLLASIGPAMSGPILSPSELRELADKRGWPRDVLPSTKFFVRRWQKMYAYDADQ
jgi:hypothetical protein